MGTPRVSVIIPSRRERWLQRTMDDVLRTAAGPVEVIPILDGYWPDPPLTADSRLVVLHRTIRRGMRDAINSAAAIARGDYLLKLDGHCALAPGWDEVLTADLGEDEVRIPRRYAFDVENWTIKPDRPPVDYHFLSYPYERPGDITCGLHGQVWRQRAADRADILLDDEMSSQGSCWCMRRAYFWSTIGPLDEAHYGTFVQEFQEIGLKCWLSGGRVTIDKRTHYAHLHKGRTYGTGYGFTTAEWEAWTAEKHRGHAYCTDVWMHDRWTDRVHDLRWLIERFWPVPTWPRTADGALDWHEVERARAAAAAAAGGTA